MVLKQITHLTSIDNLTKEQINFILDKSKQMLNILNSKKTLNICKGKILACLFFEASTRTRLSFEAAMHRLGGNVIGFADASTSSAKKGESLTDTIKTVQNYADIICIRHPLEGSSKLAAKYCKIPIINAGDGGHEHPTQTLMDLFTIMIKKNTISNLKIGLCGDLKFGRTTHSLLQALALFGNEIICISPEELRMPNEIKDKIQNYGGKIFQTENLNEVINKLDILYITRIQKERFISEKEYLRLKGRYILDKKIMSIAPKNLFIMHPLPRVDEINPEIDNDKRCIYFQQAFFGVPVRMAILEIMLKI
ncbi:MAG: aspartate carbamoyltransferase [Candidatus Aenigmarchaeota archaeon ex4484_52]|nr:MAG: aspartate carbamoyltransferase [Candidatus Aenigmarchaeota archaeon ex4484_52]